MKEADLLGRISRLFPRAGDDAAVVGRQVITNDMLVEDVDFTREMPLRFIARRSLAANLSDLAAMGSKPQYAVVALGIPEWVDAAQLVEEVASAARDQRIEVIGGDISRSEKLIVSITAIGETERPLLRKGARTGDRIYVSRPIGASTAGLHLLQHGFDFEGNARQGRPMTYAEREFLASVIRRHADPEPETALGIRLSSMAEITSCIDISDGLSTDLHNLCDASNVGADIERERIPVFPDLAAAGPRFGIDVPKCVLHGGEEYALIFTATLRESELSARVGRPVYAIGRISGELGVRMDGVTLEAGGWDHFRRG